MTLSTAFAMPTDLFNHPDSPGIVLETGETTDTKKLLQAFFTPDPLAQRLADIADVEGKVVLEPSSGHGALADACKAQGAKAIYCYEISEEFALVTTQKGYPTLVADFLTVNPDPVYDRVVMNPPFAKNQDIKHVEHALKFLKPGGVLVAIMMPSVQRTGFQKLIAGRNVEIEEVPAGTFKSSGTDIRTIILTVRNY